jgi:cytochrome c biogenesis protein CcdA
MDDSLQSSTGRSPYIILVVGVSLLSLAGYAGYAIYPRFNLSAASGAALLMLAAMAGIASFFSPCSFPLLLTLLARATPQETSQNRLRHTLRFASALALGASLFLLLAGGALSLGAGTLFQDVTFTSPAGRAIRSVVAGLLILFGLIQSGKLTSPFNQTWRVVAPLLRTQAKMRRSKPTFAFGLYGFGYVLAGFG